MRQLLDERIEERGIDDDDLAWARPYVDEARAAVSQDDVVSRDDTVTVLRIVRGRREITHRLLTGSHE